jgi:hypothetical protein
MGGQVATACKWQLVDQLLHISTLASSMKGAGRGGRAGRPQGAG